MDYGKIASAVQNLVDDRQEHTDDWRNPGWFWHHQDTTYRPFEATENPDPSQYYRIVPNDLGIFHRGQEVSLGYPGRMSFSEHDMKMLRHFLEKYNRQYMER